jgi:NAD dependent epimerase/dehydratase family enzyme
MSWIHLHDWVATVKWALASQHIAGPLNVTAPEPVTNEDFSRSLGRVLGRPAWLKAPSFALRLMLGEMADALILGGQRVLPAVAQQHGFAFQYPTLESALRQIYP